MKELSDCRVLIVDDVKANVDVLVQALSGDYKLSVALGGQQALDAVRRNPPDLVLLDIVMPDIDGYEICRRLRAADATRELPIMFLSSLEDVQRQDARLRGRRQRLPDQALRDPRGQGARPFAVEGQGLRGSGQGGGGAGPSHRPRDPDRPAAGEHSGADPGHGAGRARHPGAGTPGRRRPLRGAAARPRPRARRPGRRVGEGHPGRALHGRDDDAPAQPGAPGAYA